MPLTHTTLLLLVLALLLAPGCSQEAQAKQNSRVLMFVVRSIEKHPSPKHGLIAKGTLEVLGTGQKVEAVSGPWKKGALPAGTYEIRRSGFMLKKLTPPLKTSYCDRAGQCWFQYIQPKFETKRTHLGIHPDGWTPGTLGCIGLKTSDLPGSKSTSSWQKLFQNSTSPMTLIVTYNTPKP